MGFLKKLFLVPEKLLSTVSQFCIKCGLFTEHLSKELAEESGLEADTPTGRDRMED